MLNVTVEASKASFFNSQIVESKLDLAEKRWMSRFGAYVRSDANRSMRTNRSGRRSKPGQPPRADVGYLKKFNFFVYDPRQHSVVIGPARLRGMSGEPVPGLHEHGGVQRLMDGKVARYPARPYMRPAFNKNLKRLDELKNSIR